MEVQNARGQLGTRLVTPCCSERQKGCVALCSRGRTSEACCNKCKGFNSALPSACLLAAPRSALRSDLQSCLLVMPVGNTKQRQLVTSVDLVCLLNNQLSVLDRGPGERSDQFVDKTCGILCIQSEYNLGVILEILGYPGADMVESSDSK